jgi:hypothetical protein
MCRFPQEIRGFDPTGETGLRFGGKVTNEDDFRRAKPSP